MVGRGEVVLKTEPVGLTKHSPLLPREGILSPTQILWSGVWSVLVKGDFQWCHGFESISRSSFIRTPSFLSGESPSLSILLL